MRPAPFVKDHAGRRPFRAKGSKRASRPVTTSISVENAMPRPTRRRSLAALGACLAVFLPLAGPASSEDLPPPDGETILTVSGAIGRTNREGVASFDRAMLEALGETGFTTSTIWTDRAHRFTGVSLARLLEAVDAWGATTLSATAINDYAVSIPVSDAVEGGPVVVYAIDGAPMSVRDKGPLWLLYPFDDVPDYRNEVIYARSIWQLDRIVVHE